MDVVKRAEELYRKESPRCSCGWNSGHQHEWGCDVDVAWDRAMGQAQDEALEAEEER